MACEIFQNNYYIQIIIKWKVSNLLVKFTMYCEYSKAVFFNAICRDTKICFRINIKKVTDFQTFNIRTDS